MDFDRFTKEGELFDGHYKLLRTLSTDGATADVWLAIDVNTIDTEYSEDEEYRDENTGMMVAIKIYRPKNALDIEGEQRFRDEFKIVYECRHTNLLQPTGFSIFEEYPYLVLPYCKNGSSEQMIGQKLTDDEIWKFILDVSSGLNRLHTYDPQIVHQDIKPANILIDNINNFAITDFGISSSREKEHVGYYYDEDRSGTFAYMAPERFVEGTEPMPQSDIWAFGATLCEILTGEVPFGEDGGRGQVEASIPMPAMPGIPMAVQRIVHACLDKEPGNRPTAQELMEAASSRQYPIKKKKPIAAVTVSAAILLLAGITLWLWKPMENTVVQQRELSLEESFQEASLEMKSNDPSVFMLGYQKMDSLSKLDYVPALYEMVFTHGWYTDRESIRRKKLLGIEVDTGKDEDLRPLSDADNLQAITLLNRILEIGDSTYSVINSNAAYRLAGYYIAGRSVIKNDNDEGLRKLQQAVDWACVSGNDSLINNMKNNMKAILKQMDDK